MNEPTTYEIVIRGHATDRILGHLSDDFAIAHRQPGTTQLMGVIRDPAHLHGVLSHLTSVAIDIVSVTPTDPPDQQTPPNPNIRPKDTTMTTTHSSPAPTRRKLELTTAGGIGGLTAAATFIFGIALFVTSLTDYTEGDRTPAESVDFLVGHQGILFAWYLVIFLVFGVAIIPLARALQVRLTDVSPLLADVSAVFAYIWAGLMFATGMISNIGITAVADLNGTDPAAAETLWSSIDTVTNGLGGGNELVGGTWILLVSLAAWGSRHLPTGLNAVGIASGAAGLITLIPGLSDVGMVFGLGSIVWFAWAGIVLLRTHDDITSLEVAR
ncbi:MAG: DUF4386 family protein [Actinomycetia bacterium]|nr:DUF4386 family protein [Actinomycetes bacterium]